MLTDEGLLPADKGWDGLGADSPEPERGICRRLAEMLGRGDARCQSASVRIAAEQLRGLLEGCCVRCSVSERTRKRKEWSAKMDVDLIFRIAAIGIIVAVLTQVLIRSGREEQAMMTTLAGLIVVLMMIVGQISELFSTIKYLFNL